ncbi:DNA repair protein RAD51 homolog 3-like isoform X3 [Lycorma delicatula]|uniref:DNA repair protein RAD51 homolog 3-like isoform X3 n=1 Tax=Lycorma delicatula TaxID=130591 RepID=UPI003F50ECBE
MRPIYTLPLPFTVVSKLRDEGYLFCDDIFDGKKCLKDEIKKVLSHLPKEIWENLHELVTVPEQKSACQTLQDEVKIQKIVTFSQAVDQILGGGVFLGDVLEFCGASGSGKTQMCLQLCIAVQLPFCLGGVQGEAIFIDTDQSFSPDRLKDIAESCYNLFISASELHGSLEMNLSSLSVTKLLENVHYISIEDNIQLLSIIKLIDDFIKSNNKVKLVIIDCLTFPFLNQFILSTLVRTQQLCRIVRELQSIATEHNIAVVITNHLTTKIVHEAKLAPALGENYAHIISKRIILGNLQNSNFSAAVYKSSYLSECFAEFQITRDGIRDVI